MANIRKPRKGSMQYWPRKRAKKSYARIRSWNTSGNDVNLMGFAGYKAGMTHILITDNAPHSMTKGDEVFCPVTVIECPPIKILGLRIYKKDYYGKKAVFDVLSEKLDKELSRKIVLPKKYDFSKAIAEAEKHLEKAQDVSAIVYTQPKLTGVGSKRPEIFEINLPGDLQQKFDYVKANIGKDVGVDEVFKEGQQVDVHAVTKGKGFQGPVKRFGISLRSHKSEKTIRGPGSLGGWQAQGHVMYRVAHAGQMGYHLRTELNKWILKISKNADEINPKGGFLRYGTVKNSFVLVKGSVPGPSNRMLILTNATRQNNKTPSQAPSIEYISLESKQGK